MNAARPLAPPSIVFSVRRPMLTTSSPRSPSPPQTQDIAALAPFRDFVLTHKFGNAIDVGDLNVR